MTVREASSADADTLERLAYEAWPDAPFHDVEPDQGQIRKAIAWAFAEPNARCFLLCDGETAVGVLGVLLTTHSFTGQRIGIQWWWWIRTESRNGSGLKLLKSAEEWAKQNGAVALQLIAPSARFRSLCERLAFRPVEVMYQKELV
jgi:GNAT superfamily N-acetyltransferase